MFSFLLSKHIGLLWHMVSMCLYSSETVKLLSNLHDFIFPPAIYEHPDFCTSSPKLHLAVFVIVSILMSVQWYLTVILTCICIVLMTKIWDIIPRHISHMFICVSLCMYGLFNSLNTFIMFFLY